MIKSYATWVQLSAQLLIAALFLPINWGGLSVTIFGVIAIIGIVKKKYSFQSLSALTLFPIIFAILILGSFYAENTKESWLLIERTVSFILLPFFCQALTVLSNRQWKHLFHTYLYSAVAVSFAAISFAIIIYAESGSSSINESNHFIYNIFMHQRLTATIGLHAIYLNLFIGFGAILTINQLVKNWNQLNLTTKIAYFLYLVFNIIMFYLLKSSILSMAFPIVISIVYFKRIKAYFLKSPTTLLLSIFIAILFLGFFFTVIQTKLESLAVKNDYSAQSLGPLTIRIATWEATAQVIKDNWFKGVGTGNLEKPLLVAFKNLNFQEGYSHKYNAHNMYLQYWAMNGIAGIAAFCALIISLIYIGIKRKEASLVGLVLLFAIFSFTESTLQTQRGILFFTFISCAIYWKSSPQNNS